MPFSTDTYSIDALYECVARRDGSRVWRSVWDGKPTITGGNRWLHLGHAAKALDAESFASGTRLRVYQTFRVEEEVR